MRGHWQAEVSAEPLESAEPGAGGPRPCRQGPAVPRRAPLPSEGGVPRGSLAGAPRGGAAFPAPPARLGPEPPLGTPAHGRWAEGRRGTRRRLCGGHGRWAQPGRKSARTQVCGRRGQPAVRGAFLPCTRPDADIAEEAAGWGSALVVWHRGLDGVSSSQLLKRGAGGVTGPGAGCPAV